MDAQTIFAQAGGTAGIIAGIALIYKTVNHKRCRSRCCGKNMEISFDIEETSPQGEKPKLQVNPMRPAS